MSENFTAENKILETKNTSYLIKLIYVFLGIFVFLAAGYFFFLSSPLSFVPGSVIEIKPGMSLHGISAELKNQNIIRSQVAFEAFVILYGGEKHIKFSSYVFENKMPVYSVAKWIVKGDKYRAPVVVTIPEGFYNSEIADSFSPRLANFNKQFFLDTAKQGYLFPDTYYFFTGDTEKTVIDEMSKNYEKKISPIRKEIIASGKSESEIIIMASIIEKEAKGDNDRSIISGILWKRLDSGMRLQVDAAPNTYKTTGLPKVPISNPGLEAIHAAIYPQSSSYLYYLHGKDGNTYYAKTFTEHKKNIAKYLK